MAMRVERDAEMPQQNWQERKPREGGQVVEKKAVGTRESVSERKKAFSSLTDLPNVNKSGQLGPNYPLIGREKKQSKCFYI